MAVITADALGRADSAFHTLVGKINSPLPIVMVNWCEDYKFNEQLLKIKDFILCCFAEYGWNEKLTDTHIWGKNSEKFQRYYTGDWKKFDDWVKSNPPKLLLKRELLKKDVSDTAKPIEYPCLVNEFSVDTKEVFYSRPINVFQYWGRSNENRMRIHGQIWLNAYKRGFQVCDNIYFVSKYLQEEQGEKWITLWMPHWARIDINQLMAINGISKLSLSWAGAGFKCFRHMESPANSVMVMHKNDYAWTFDWVNKENCIMADEGNEIFAIEHALKNDELYDIYLRGVETVNKYRLPNYLKHIEATINDSLHRG